MHRYEHTPFQLALIGGLLTLLAIPVFLLGGSGNSHAERPTAGVAQEVQSGGVALITAQGAGEAQTFMNVQHYNLVVYVMAVQDANLHTYVNAVQASEYQAWLASQPAPTYSAPTPSYSAPPSSGGACGGATNGADQYIHRESGGDPYIVNGGGHAYSPQAAGRAFGCYQILPSTWASSCSDITTYDPASQARCASRLPDSAWAL